MRYVVEMNRIHGDFSGIFGITREEFGRLWHDWLRVTFQ
jgi:hypothetical protein